MEIPPQGHLGGPSRPLWRQVAPAWSGLPAARGSLAPVAGCPQRSRLSSLAGK